MVERLERALAGASGLGRAIPAWEHYRAFREVLADHPDGVSERGQRFFVEAAEELGAADDEEALRERAAIRATRTPRDSHRRDHRAPTSTPGTRVAR
ncbi:hypothetical protein LWC35_28670 [Pseudonocardia kujensis]|uniref:hypothetical protein n=1 Tax=Pseudonocardia kujensis TaxID=1128675 RepID=UPI001E4B5DFB|nr:hypothetical protein [Pseudonocardia kujensis]MCE0766850.1 hypothetical protein [Pseudonocardia kujensis]